MKNTPITAAKLLEKNKVDINAKNPLGKPPFCHYTSLDSLDKILDSGYMFASAINETNDIAERNRHAKDAEATHVLCFCQSDSEKIPFWYLYAGIRGDGTRLRITSGNMAKLIKGIKQVYPVVAKKPDINCPLEIGRDVEMDYGWVYYVKDIETTAKYRNDWYFITDDYNAFWQNNFFVKDYPWEYEKEFRLVFRVVNGAKYAKLAVHIQSALEKPRIMTGPEWGDLDLLQMPGFQKYLANRIEKSALSIKMDLLNRNRKGLVSSFDSFVEKSTEEERADMLRALLVKRSKIELPD